MLSKHSPLKFKTKRRRRRKIFRKHHKTKIKKGKIRIYFANITKQKLKKVKLGYSKSIPEWRTIEEGLNIIGKCLNEDCDAFENEVICPVGFGIFDLMEDEDIVECPICFENFEPVTCGFWKCYFFFWLWD